MVGTVVGFTVVGAVVGFTVVGAVVGFTVVGVVVGFAVVWVLVGVARVVGVCVIVGLDWERIYIPHLFPVYTYPFSAYTSWQYALLAVGTGPESTCLICDGLETSRTLTPWAGPPAA